MRPHTMFIQSQVLAWQDGTSVGRPGTQVKILSSDSNTGAATLLIRYPAGYNDTAGAIEPAEEILLLDGALQLNDRLLVNLSYARLPRGWPRQHFASETGGIALTMFCSAPAPTAGAAADDGVEPVLCKAYGRIGAINGC